MAAQIFDGEVFAAALFDTAIEVAAGYLIDPVQAKAHVHREASYPDEQITPYLLAAESKAQRFINRRIFADQDALDAAVDAAPAALIAAGLAYSAAVLAYDAELDPVLRGVQQAYASSVYSTAQTAARETLAGIVINDQIRAAILVIFEHLYAQRGEVAMPLGSEYLLWDYRVGLGV